MTAERLAVRFATLTFIVLFTGKAWSGELHDAPFWAALQSLNTLIPKYMDDRRLGVISVDLEVPVLSWIPIPRERQRHSILWFKIDGRANPFGGLFLTALDSEDRPFFFPVDPSLSLRCSDIREAADGIEIIEEVDRFISSFCE
jgi:hypothetical protein